MSGVFIETCSNRWLLVFVAVLAACQTAFFLLGGLIAPNPATHQTVSGTICHAESTDRPEKWYYSRGQGACRPITHLYDNDESDKPQNLHAENIVFAFQLPLPRNGQKLAMSRWFQTMLGILQPDIAYAKEFPLDAQAKMRLQVRIGYRNGDETTWHEIARSNETRVLDCQLDRRFNYHYFCAPMPLFELGSVHHDEYLLNIRIPDEGKGYNSHIGKLEGLELVEIHQTGGFSMVWYWTKTIMTPCVLCAVLFFWRCVQGLPRRPALLEKMLFALGLAMLQLCVPLEWVTLYIDMPYFMVLSDLRQGIFHSVLMAFWIIFAGEHMMDEAGDRNRLAAYWKHLSAVACGCMCLFVFDMCERGVQLSNPFHSIWSTPEGTRLGMFFIGLAVISACSYFVFLCWMVYRVFRQIQSKKGHIHSMNVRKRLFYQGLIFRFQFLMGISVVCAALTVVAFVMGQWTESHWKWGSTDVEVMTGVAGEHVEVHAPALEYTSSFFVGVFGMWCLYVISLLVLYSPNSKYYGAELLVQNGQSMHNTIRGTSATAAADDEVHEAVQVRQHMLNGDVVGYHKNANGAEIEFRTLTPRTIAAAVRETDIVDNSADNHDDDADDVGEAPRVHVDEITENISLTAFVRKAAQD